MFDLSQNGWSHDAVVDLLQSSYGLANTKYRVDVLRDGAPIAQIKYTDCRIDCESEQDVKYSMNITLEGSPWLQYSVDFLQPVMFIEKNGLKFECKLVPMKPMTPVKRIYDGYSMLSIDAYDELVMIKTSSLGKLLHFPAYTIYTTAIENELIESGYRYIKIEPSPLYMSIEREDWERSDNKLQIYNMLLREINYTDLTVDNYGSVISRPYTLPTIESARIRYMVDRSNIVPRKTLEMDSYALPNVFTGIASNPDIEIPLIYIFQNTDPSSPSSIVNNGGYAIHEVLSFNDIADKQTLIDAVHRRAAEVNASYEHVTIQTNNMPHHETYEPIFFWCDGVEGLFEEISWSISNFGPDGTMSHVARRLIYE